MEFEVLYTLDNEQQFWDELEEITSPHCQTSEHIDRVLRLYLRFTTNYREEYLNSEYEIARCSCMFLDSILFKKHEGYVRTQIIHALLQEDAANTLHIVTSILLFDGRHNDRTFELMNEEGAFPRLVELIRRQGDDDDGLLHRRLLELLYEMSRIQRIRLEDLRIIDDPFVAYLFQIIEELSNDVNDPYHYPVIRVLLVLNEQYMVCAHEPGLAETSRGALTNRVIKVLSMHGSAYKTFGENLILLLNRESSNPIIPYNEVKVLFADISKDETSLQLLILKLLYLLFTTQPTYEYFYTNDLRVLVDVMIRNLLDLPDDAEALRHTYLRVLYPLLSHTQLRHPPHYKRDEIIRLLNMLSEVTSAHFKPLDDTTVRLTRRCMKVPWLKEQDNVANGLLGISLGTAGESTVSVVEVAGTKEKPGVLTRSRKNSHEPQAYDAGNGVRLDESDAGNADAEAGTRTGQRDGRKVSGSGSSVVIGDA